MQRTQRRVLLIAATVLVWAAALTQSLQKFELLAKGGVKLTLATKPAHVRVSLDGEPWFRGDYVETPITMTVMPGRHRLKVAREGYVAHIVTVEGDSGDAFQMDEVVLQKNPDLLFAAVRVEATRDGAEAATYVELDDGLVRGETPLTTEELTADSEHSLLVYPSGKESDVRFRCHFLPRGADFGGEHVIRIKIGPDSVRASGCVKVLKRNDQE